MKTNEIEHIKLVSATYLHDYVIRFVFSDGKVHDLDFFPFIGKTPQNPMVSKYLNVDLFKKFETNPPGDILWNKGEMCYGIFTIYYGFDKGPEREALYYKNTDVIRKTHFHKKQKKLLQKRLPLVK
ncbi:hypothetical protein FACS1894180_0780 [Bacteroidia bacterium]|nr:hypothetical protein FACS1894180_0780 [Bacteroidia bacterium]